MVLNIVHELNVSILFISVGNSVLSKYDKFVFIQMGFHRWIAMRVEGHEVHQGSRQVFSELTKVIKGY